MKNLLFFLILSPSLLFGQIRNLETSLDTNAIQIGQRARLILKTDLDSKSAIHFQAWPDSVPGLELSIKSSTDTIKNDKGTDQLRHIYYLTSFDSGYFVIPPLAVAFSDEIHRDTLFTEALLLKVSIPSVDSTDVIHDIYEPYSIPYSFWEILEMIWPYLLFILLAIALFFILKKYLRKNKLEQNETTIIIDPDQWALDELSKIKQLKYLEDGKFKLFHIEISDILRKYIELKLQVNALEKTSDELLEQLELHSVISKNEWSILEKILKQCDRVKFAKHRPGNETSELLHTNAVVFVKSMIRVEETDNSEKETES